MFFFKRCSRCPNVLVSTEASVGLGSNMSWTLLYKGGSVNFLWFLLPGKLSPLFHSHYLLLALLGLFTNGNERFPISTFILQLVKSLPFHNYIWGLKKVRVPLLGRASPYGPLQESTPPPLSEGYQPQPKLEDQHTFLLRWISTEASVQRKSCPIVRG